MDCGSILFGKYIKVEQGHDAADPSIKYQEVCKWHWNAGQMQHQINQSSHGVQKTSDIEWGGKLSLIFIGISSSV